MIERAERSARLETNESAHHFAARLNMPASIFPTLPGVLSVKKGSDTQGTDQSHYHTKHCHAAVALALSHLRLGVISALPRPQRP